MEIIGYEIVISVVLNGTDESAESTSVTERALLDFLEDPCEVWVKIVRTVSVGVTKILDVLC
jgi:hypothetical protein